MIKTICVCGAGTMGSGIAQVAAVAGFSVIQFDVDEAMLTKSCTNIQNNLSADVIKNRITQSGSEEALSRLTFTSKMNDCIANIIIEAIIEKPDAKVALFKQLAALNASQTILATNSSSLSINAIAEQLEDASRVVGMHFFNPAPAMKLVEIIQGHDTSYEVITAVAELAKQMGKTPVVCKDSPGFIVNRVARPYYLEALHMVELSITDVETIDKALEACGFKLGPFKLMDLIGLDINYSVSNHVWEALNKPARLTPSSIQKAKVDAGELGRKSGKGFYEYGEG